MFAVFWKHRCGWGLGVWEHLPCGQAWTRLISEGWGCVEKVVLQGCREAAEPLASGLLNQTGWGWNFSSTFPSHVNWCKCPGFSVSVLNFKVGIRITTRNK